MAEEAIKLSTQNAGVMYVYCGPEFTGKTVAAKQLLRRLNQQKGADFPSLYVDTTHGDLYSAMGEKLSVPPSMTDLQWTEVLFYAFSNNIPPIQVSSSGWPSWLPRSCFEDTTGDAGTAFSYQSVLGSLLPVIMIDGFALLNWTNYVQ